MQEDITVKVKQSINQSNPINIQSGMVDPILKGFFRLNDSEITNSDKDKLSEINSYLGEFDDEMDKIMALKDIRFRLGSPQLGVKELDHVHKYIRIRNSIKQQETQLKAMEQ